MQPSESNQPHLPKFTISSIMAEAWHALKGFKKIFWKAALIILLFTSALVLAHEFSMLLFSPVKHFDNNGLLTTHSNVLIYILISAVTSYALWAIIMLLQLGLQKIAIDQVRKKSLSLNAAFQTLSYFGRIFLSYSIILALTVTELAPLIFYYSINSFHLLAASASLKWLPITISVAYIGLIAFTNLFFLFAPLAVLDKNISVLPAFKRSVQLIKPNWLRVCGCMLLNLLLLTAFIVLIDLVGHFISIWLGVGLSLILMVWLWPYLFLVIGAAYQRLDSMYQRRHDEAAKKPRLS